MVLLLWFPEAVRVDYIVHTFSLFLLQWKLGVFSHRTVKVSEQIGAIQICCLIPNDRSPSKGSQEHVPSKVLRNRFQASLPRPGSLARFLSKVPCLKKFPRTASQARFQTTSF